jgi:hypothetical protein
MRKINPAEEYELKFLRDQVDHTMTRWCTQSEHHDLSSDARRAREELTEFVNNLRKKGVNI